MAILKCKMCGGTLEINDNQTTAECEYCGTLQTLPKANNDIIQNLFNRANNLRIKCEFDKAEQIYEKILHEDDTEPEAHWGIILCKYGIEYVEDPNTYKRVPTCHRTSYEAITADPDYLAAIENADSIQRLVYESEARAIDEIQKNILNIVKNEKPFDVFICYKETDENGTRTVDSTIANDIYYQLTQSGLKVFYAAITLEDKLGQEYEPYIFAALNSAKVMLVIGTKPEYFEAVWVKNEWSRFLKIMKSDRNKLLIPCYRDMDAYDLPEEFSHLQAQDMSKIGFIADVVRGIGKVTSVEKETANRSSGKSASSGGANAQSLLKRVFIFIEDGDWKSADEYCERVLDLNPESAEAYLGKILVEYKAHDIDELGKGIESFASSKNYQKIIRFGDEKLKHKINEALETATENQNLYISVVKEKGESVEKNNNLNEILNYINDLISVKTTSALMSDEISSHFLNTISILRLRIPNNSLLEIINFFENLDALPLENTRFSDEMYGLRDYTMREIIKLLKRNTKYSNDFDELNDLLFKYKTALEYKDISPSLLVTLKDDKIECEEKIKSVKELIEKEKKIKAMTSGLEKELANINEEITIMQRNLYNSPERGQIIKIEKENALLIKEQEGLGLFKSKERKVLQDKIDRNNYTIKKLDLQNKKNIDNINNRLPLLKKRRDDIEKEINRLKKSI